MAEIRSEDRSLWRLVAVPAAITLAVTALRLTGELLGWSPALFNRSAGGGGALVGISWLAPVFGVYFGLKLAGRWPGRTGRALGLAVLAVLALPASAAIALGAGIRDFGLPMVLVYLAGAAASVWLGWKAWPALGRTLIAYAFAARIPVALLMLFAILGDWGTHYDVAPPDFPAMDPIAKWLWIGVFPQATIWIGYTVAIGALFGVPAGAIAARRRHHPNA